MTIRGAQEMYSDTIWGTGDAGTMTMWATGDVQRRDFGHRRLQ